VLLQLIIVEILVTGFGAFGSGLHPARSVFRNHKQWSVAGLMPALCHLLIYS
jgi:hypothetical protein